MSPRWLLREWVSFATFAVFYFAFSVFWSDPPPGGAVRETTAYLPAAYRGGVRSRGADGEECAISPSELIQALIYLFASDSHSVLNLIDLDVCSSSDLDRVLDFDINSPAGRAELDNIARWNNELWPLVLVGEAEDQLYRGATAVLRKMSLRPDLLELDLRKRIATEALGNRLRDALGASAFPILAFKGVAVASGQGVAEMLLSNELQYLIGRDMSIGTTLHRGQRFEQLGSV